MQSPYTTNSKFPKSDRVRKRTEYLFIQNHGKKFKNDYFVGILSDNPYHRPRIGIVTSKKVGKAHVRNRIKRLLREVFRQNKPYFPKRDMVLIVKNDFPKNLRYAQVKDIILAFIAGIK